MNEFKVDLHNHTVLSPCGDLEMSPENLIKTAVNKGINILGITDHNTTKHCHLANQIAKNYDIHILNGAEVTTSEEVHCLVFFDDEEKLSEFESMLSDNILKIKNVPEKSGYQVVIDENELIVEEIDYSLISAINLGVEELENWVHERKGIFIPAHINREYYSLVSQLGFIPNNINADAFELSKKTTVKEIISQYPFLSDKTLIRNSDAHYIETIGTNTSTYLLETPSFEEIKMALRNEKGRKVIIK